MITADSVLIELESLTYREVCQNNDEKMALSCANALINCLYLNFKSKLMYVPLTNKKNSDQMYKNICKEFTGHNQQELAIKFGRSEQNIYSIIKRERIKFIKKHQKDIFSDDLYELDSRPFTLIILEEYLPHELVRCGLSKEESKALSSKISNHLCATFPGVSIYITEAIRKKRCNETQTSIF